MASQQVRTVHEPLTPWHLHIMRMNFLTAWQETNLVSGPVDANAMSSFVFLLQRNAVATPAIWLEYLRNSATI